MLADCWTSLWRVGFLAAIFVLSPPTVQAGSKDVAQAEHVRLSEEMNKHAGRSRWQGVERAYITMQPLVKKGVVLSYRDHYQGAQSARELGNINQVYERLQRAAKQKMTDDVKNWLQDVRNNYGQVELVIPRSWKGDVALSIAAMPLFPDQRSTIGLAQSRVEGRKSYMGLLPVGDYTFADQTFTVVPGGDIITVELDSKGSKGRSGQATLTRRKKGERGRFRFTYVGPRADLGVGWTQAADASGGGSQPGGFSGPSGRVGGGLELGVGGPWAVFAQVGYHNLFGSPSDDSGALEDQAGFTARADNMHMGYAWLAGSVRLNDLWLSVGPTYSMGSAGVTGINSMCLENPGATECGAVGDADEDILRISRMKGDIRAGGLAMSASWSMWTVGPMEAALSLNTGAQSDLSRWYPWATLAVTLAPPGGEE